MTDPSQNEKMTIWGAIILGLTTIVFFGLAVGMMYWSDDVVPTNEVGWETEEAKLNDDKVPATVFWHDEEKDRLFYRGEITQKVRDELLQLNFEDIDPKERITYSQSIDKLTFESNVQQASNLVFLMFITAIGGIIGVQARSISYFILHACVKNDLNLKIWWAWYWLRPLLGMIFGPLVVLLVKTGVLPTQDVTQTDTLTMFVLSILVGMVASMFFDKLVETAQNFFGLTADDAPPQGDGEKTPKPVEASGKWDANEAVIEWTESDDPKLHHYEVRMTEAATYDAKNHSVLASPQPGTLKYRTGDYPANSGDTVSFKVYVVLDDKAQESGSEAVPITKPKP